ncbi:MAG: crosslink repair DNA glycosylase YcaQ family protein [Propionicimonas sp.]|uniref:DNA glycosylase AlkZ-like family protein n=1 Tax=Propionicimonas sp. TaxID=1955623 RepID=UPI003D10D282
MGRIHEISRADARRIAVRAQLLDDDRPDDPLEVVRHLTLLQYDVTRAVAPSHDLVLWSRIGPSYDRREVQDALDQQALVEVLMHIRPAGDLRLYRAEMDAWPVGDSPWERSVAQWVDDNNACRMDVLQRLREDGPLPTRDLPDTCARPWRSTGWSNQRNLSRLLDFLVERGEVALSGRDGGERWFDLAERVYPDDPAVPREEAVAERDRRRLAALGIARARATRTPVEPNGVGEAGEPAIVEGVRGRWRVDPAQLDQPFRGRVALLSPLDRLVFDRARTADLFAFDYQLEMYKPAAARRWGYWALPVLDGEDLVGKVDATTDRELGELVVHAVHEDGEWTRARRSAVHDELASLAAWLRVDLVMP